MSKKYSSFDRNYNSKIDENMTSKTKKSLGDVGDQITENCLKVS